MTKQATLKELVLGAVEGFLSTETPFSVYDVTQSIRQVVNSGAVEIPALFVSDQAFKFEIGHEDVKFYFNELNDQELFSAPLKRQFNGQYFVYEAGKIQSTPDPTSTARFQKLRSALNAVPATNNPFANAAAALSNAFNAFSNTSTMKVPSATPVVKQQVANSTKLSRTEVINRVRTYFNNRKNRAHSPTNKQIQSAIKRNGKSTGWSRAELGSIWNGIAAGTI